MEEDTDKKFVRALFNLVAWCLMFVPILYGVYTHNWLVVGTTFSAIIGTAIGLALKKTPKH